MMGLSRDLGQRGDFKTNDLLAAPILIVRCDDGQINAFLKVSTVIVAPW